jgi:DNA-binding Lrp family transcriptional regulator
MTEFASRLLSSLQRALPPVAHPFGELARELGASEADVILTTQDLIRAGTIRRLGAIFDARRLGYVTTLVAATVNESDLERIAAPIVGHPGTTHVYLRDGRPNLWFTLHARGSDALLAEIAALQSATEVSPLLDLRSERVFKLRALFDAAAGTASVDGTHVPRSPGPASAVEPLTDEEIRLVAAMADGIVPEPDPWAHVARRASVEPERFLEIVRSLIDRGVLRRIGASVNHRALRFTANAMVAWVCRDERIESAGGTLAASRMVSHCYHRRSYPEWPANLYAMCHARTRDELLAEIERLTAAARLDEPRVLFTLRELKKSAARYFAHGQREQAGAS